MCITRTLSLSLLIASSAFAQGYPMPLLKDEGTGTTPPSYYSLDCVGPAISCQNSKGLATLTIDVDSADIDDLSASNTEVLTLQGGAITGDADFTYNTSTNLLDLGGGTAEFNTIGLAGAAAQAGSAIYLGTLTSSSLLSPLLSDITYTGGSTLAAALQSELGHTGTAVSPTIWGAILGAFAGTNNGGIIQTYGAEARSGFVDNTQVLGAGEILVAYGLVPNVLTGGSAGGTHNATSQVFKLGFYIPAFGTASGATNVDHGVLAAENINLVPDVSLGLDAGVFTQADSRVMYDSGSSEVRVEVDGTEMFVATSSALAFFNTAPQAQTAAFTQTFAAASRIHPVMTSAAVATTASTQTNPWGYTTQAQADAIPAAINALQNDVIATKEVLNQVIDDLQGYGLLQ